MQRVEAFAVDIGPATLEGELGVAAGALRQVQAPTLLIVGGDDEAVLELNEQAFAVLAAPQKEISVVAGASHLFEEPGTLEEVARLAARWFTRHLGGPGLSA